MKAMDSAEEMSLGEEQRKGHDPESNPAKAANFKDAVNDALDIIDIELRELEEEIKPLLQ